MTSGREALPARKNNKNSGPTRQIIFTGSPDNNALAAPRDPAEPNPGHGRDEYVPETPRALDRRHNGPQDHLGGHATPPSGRQKQHSQEPGLIVLLYSMQGISIPLYTDGPTGFCTRNWIFKYSGNLTVSQESRSIQNKI